MRGRVILVGDFLEPGIHREEDKERINRGSVAATERQSSPTQRQRCSLEGIRNSVEGQPDSVSEGRGVRSEGAERVDLVSRRPATQKPRSPHVE